MDYRGLSVIGVWAGTLGVSALFLNFNFTTDFITVLVLAATQVSTHTN
jgi:hypothetical protein